MTDPETVRLTYAELAQARGVTVGAAKRLAVRHRWPKQVGNDGLARIEVPASFARDVPRDIVDDVPRDVPDGVPGDVSWEISADLLHVTEDILRVAETTEAAVTALREQLAVANERADRAEARVRELQEELQTQMAAYRQLVTVLAEKQPARRSWWPWGRRRS